MYNPIINVGLYQPIYPKVGSCLGLYFFMFYFRLYDKATIKALS